ncbi:hypothetical protein QBC36DRAFT_377721 [Triangularia setosa]|uniref:Uncharacterized protein n=1 Tax=Triangularia setosa TaxID=2587417 RepID=A0AAN6W8H5_9PEZI|nr:hypothetical protein QBC36DRAFT_377721 [Podospora setosa]
MPPLGFSFPQSWWFLSVDTDVPVPDAGGDDSSPSTLANSSPEYNTGQTSTQATSLVVPIDSESDDDEVLDITKALRQKASLTKPPYTIAASVPPPPGSLAAEAQARPVPETPVKKRGLGRLNDSSDSPAGSPNLAKGVGDRSEITILCFQAQSVAAAYSSSRHSRCKREERRRRKGLKKASCAERSLPSQQPIVQTLESRAIDREMSRAIRHTPITAGENAERRLWGIKARGEQAYQSSTNMGALMVDFLKETGTSGADEAITVLGKRLSEAETQKPRTQVTARMNKPKRGPVGRSWKYRPGFDEGQFPGPAGVRVDYGCGQMELFWTEVETRGLQAVVELRDREKGELTVESSAAGVHQRKRYDVWSVVVVKREDPNAQRGEKTLVFECGMEDKGVQTGEDMEVDAEVEGDAEMGNGIGGSEEADIQTTTEASPKEYLPSWHRDYYADPNESDDDDGGDESTSPFTTVLPYNPPAPLVLPSETNVLDLFSMSHTHPGSYTWPNRANMAALGFLLAIVEPKNNYMNGIIHYHSEFKPTQEFQFEEAGLDNVMTRALFSITWRPPGDAETEKFKWEFEQVRVWAQDTKLEGPIDLGNFVVQGRRARRVGLWMRRGRIKRLKIGVWRVSRRRRRRRGRRGGGGMDVENEE